VTNPTSWPRMIRSVGLRAFVFALTFYVAFAALASRPMQAQTFSVIHNFTGGGDGWFPIGTTISRGGTIYGSEQGGCCGGIFKMQSAGAGWILTPLYMFPSGGPDGVGPGPVTIGPDSSLFATNTSGGITGGQCGQAGCGAVINLRVPPNTSVSALRPWNVNLVYSFAFANDGAQPGPDQILTFDGAGNMYGTTQFGGATGNGAVFRLVEGDGGWHENVAYSFSARPDGNVPESGVIVDPAGNIYGTTSLGGTANFGTVFELSPSGSGYTEKVLYNFQNGIDGSQPWGELVLDSAGNLYGTASSGGDGNGGTVFQLTPSGGSWSFNLLYAFQGNGSFGPIAGLTMDAAGNLYGTTAGDGAFGDGSVYKLTRSGGSWTFADLHDFSGTDGRGPVGGVTLGFNGNLYGTAKSGGAFSGSQCVAGCGVIWQITP
jgi:uncharacterized repeat protein (TIGR03803 family)